MRPVLIVVGRVLAQDPPQMALIPDQVAVQELAAASPDPAFGDRVHAGRPDVAQDGLDPGIGEDGVEGGGEVGAAVADHESDSVCLLVQVHGEVAGLVGGPFPGRVQGDPQDADAPGSVLDYGEDVGLGAVEQVGCEEVACQDRVRLRTQELRPARPGPPGCGVDSGGLQDLPCRRRRYLHSQAGQLAVDPAVPPAREMLSSTFRVLCGAGDYVEPRDVPLLVVVSVSRVVSRIAGCELHITFRCSQVFEPLEDVLAGVPAGFTFLVGNQGWAAFDRFAFHRHVDLDVLTCGGDADVPGPGLDHVELGSGLE